MSRPLRVAIVGSGPSGMYAADALLSQQDIPVSVDIIDKLPSPFGLVRYGVAPDHL
ncbi:MAG: NAD(P)-binding protein, partial [Candidatus Nanopelagicales bacterium]